MSENKWSLYNNEGNFLTPINWTGGNQNNSVNEILEVFNDDDNKNITIEKQKKVFLDSKCGSGKSTILLNVIKNLGRGIVVVPSLMLQDQYADDYAGDGGMYILRTNEDINSKLKIGTMIGRKNFVCKYLEDNIKKGETVLDDGLIIFDKLNITCAMKGLPCNRTLSKGENRISTGCKCKYFVIPPRLKENIESMNKPVNTDNTDNSEYGDDDFKNITYLDIAKDNLKCDRIEYYMGVDGNEYGLFVRNDTDSVCGYYKQFYNYLDDVCDVIVFNRWKWDIETTFGRKPVTDIECIDEADEFLNGLNQSIIISNHMINRIYKINKSEDDLNASDKIIIENKKILLDYFMKAHNKINEFIRSEKSNKNKDINDGKGSVLIAHSVIIKINDFIEYINNLKDEHKIVISDQDDEISEMIYKLDLILKYVDKCSISTSEGANSISIHYNIPYPDLVLSNLLELSSDKILFCSGTKHDDYTMKNLFGLNFDKMVYGRRDQPGTLTLAKPKHSMVEVTYKNWQNDEFQEYYEKLLKYIVEKLNEKGDTLVLTPAKKYVVGLVKYLRSKNANVEIDFSNYEGGNDDAIRIGNRVGNKITISYRMKRGIDLKGDKCRVLIWTKYPYIDVSDGYVQALFNRFGKKTWIMLNNMANMDSVQGVCRGLRNDEDYCVFATPDSKVYGIIEKWWNEQLRVKEGK